MIEIHPDYEERLSKLGLKDFSSFTRHFGCEKPRGKTGAIVQRSMLGEEKELLDVYFKIYEFKKPSWRFLGRRSKARCEYENYGFFQQRKIPAAQHLAYGEDRDSMGRLKRAFILTRTVAGSATLVDYFEKELVNRFDANIRRTRREIMNQLADLTRSMHQARFYHHDLVWRNILVTISSKADEPRLWLIDCPRGRLCRWRLLGERKQVKDLGSLDKTQARHCTRTERLVFFLRYLQKPRLDSEAKSVIRKVLDYRRHRWPDDWNERGA